MKRFLTRAAAKTASFFWSWGFLKFVLWTVTLIVLFYVEEDWRGARAWAATKAKWEAKGESFEFDRLIPAPVPDDQNLGALPLFKLEPDFYNEGVLEPLALRRALQSERPGGGTYSGGILGNWERGKPPDPNKITQAVAADYVEVFKSAPTGKSALEQFQALYPLVGNLCTAAATCRYCRFEQNYRIQPPDNLHLSLLTSQLQVARDLTLHALLALEADRPDVALKDLHVNFMIASGLREEPLLVSGLCAIGVGAIGMSAVENGLAVHAWGDSQLIQMEGALAQIDYLATYQNLMRGEATGMVIPVFDRYKVHPFDLRAASRANGDQRELKLKIQNLTILLPPSGWIDLAKSRAVSADLNAVSFVNSKDHLVYPKRIDPFAEEAKDFQNTWRGHTLWGMLASAAAGPTAEAAKRCAEAQVYVDEARIACALERYRWAHGDYPVSLDLLVPSYIVKLPHDIMNGKPYAYRLRRKGAFLLYSVGWNQKDDGGISVFLDPNQNSHSRLDNEHGDWVWPSPM